MSKKDNILVNNEGIQGKSQNSLIHNPPPVETSPIGSVELTDQINSSKIIHNPEPQPNTPIATLQRNLGRNRNGVIQKSSKRSNK